MVDSKGNRDTGVLELLLWSRPIPGQPDFTGRWAGVPIQKGQIIRGESVERTHLYWEHTGAGKIICKVWAFPKGSASSPFAEMDITYRVFDGETGLFSGQARVGLQNTAPKAAVQSAAVTKTAADTTKAANTKPAAAKQAVPKVWTFKYTSPVSGQFAPSRVKGGQWVETNAEGAYHFIEMSRKSEYIELYDPSRQITVRLYATSCHIRRPANPDQFVLLYDGRWE